MTTRFSRHAAALTFALFTTLAIFSGVSSYYVLGIPWAYFIAPLLVLLRPTLDIAFSLTLLLTGFACSYVALAMLEDRIERGIALLAAATIMYFSLTTGLLIGIVLTLALVGPPAWRDSSQRGGIS